MFKLRCFTCAPVATPASCRGGHWPLRDFALLPGKFAPSPSTFGAVFPEYAEGRCNAAAVTAPNWGVSDQGEEPYRRVLRC